MSAGLCEPGGFRPLGNGCKLLFYKIFQRHASIHRTHVTPKKGFDILLIGPASKSDHSPHNQSFCGQIPCWDHTKFQSSNSYFILTQITTVKDALCSSCHNHPFVDHFRYVKALEDEKTIAKQTIPAPAQTLAQFWMPFARKHTEAFYSSAKPLMDDIAQAYIAVLHQLYDAGCRNVQFDDCTWGMLADKNGQEMHAATKEGLLAVQNAYKDINNQVINGAPEGMNITTHVCRGNYHSTYASSGPYDSVADVLFGEENVSAYYLEFDDERSGGFAPLAKIGSGQKVVLGLITTKQPQLENKEAVIARIHEAAKYIPLDRLYLSPQCGFASCEIGNKLTEEEQWAKLALVKEIAEEVWG